MITYHHSKDCFSGCQPRAQYFDSLLRVDATTNWVEIAVFKSAAPFLDFLVRRAARYKKDGPARGSPVLDLRTTSQRVPPSRFGL
ncbi:hypothetical protein MESS4_430080 [Mesorhizobium sp. STM 4661]|nr:hypothetical protein MESS4_430080 [Mesorhizobium sp. STM 4661]